MLQFLFVWHDEQGNNAFAIIEAGSLPRACDIFQEEHGREYFAVFEGCNLQAREFYP